MEFSCPEYRSGYPIPSPVVDLLDPGIKPGSPALQADSLPTGLSGKPRQRGTLPFKINPPAIPLKISLHACLDMSDSVQPYGL